MKWTTEKPTEPGWYWVRLRLRGEIRPLWWDAQWSAFANCPRNGTLRQGRRLGRCMAWAGPIPMPEEP